MRGDADGFLGIGILGVATGNAIGISATSVGNDALTATSTNQYGASLKGGRAALFVGSSQTDPRTRTDLHSVGEIYKDETGTLWYCVVTGHPGTWRRLSANSASGAMEVITPQRIVDTGIGKGVPKPGADNALLTIAAGGVGIIPSDATAVFGAIGIINPNSGGIPFATIFSADLASPPVTANLVYPGGISTSTTFVVSLGKQREADLGKFKLCLRRITDLTIDIQGYYL